MMIVRANRESRGWCRDATIKQGARNLLLPGLTEPKQWARNSEDYTSKLASVEVSVLAASRLRRTPEWRVIGKQNRIPGVGSWAGQRPSPGVGCHRSSRYPVNPGMSANSLPHCEPARVRPWRVLRSGFHTFRCVFLFAPSAPAVQVFIPTMKAFDRSQLIIEIRQRFAARCCSRNRDDSPARSVLTQPSYVDLAGRHLLRRPDIDVAQRR